MYTLKRLGWLHHHRIVNAHSSFVDDWCTFIATDCQRSPSYRYGDKHVHEHVTFARARKSLAHVAEGEAQRAEEANSQQYCAGPEETCVADRERRYPPVYNGV